MILLQGVYSNRIGLRMQKVLQGWSYPNKVDTINVQTRARIPLG